MTDTSESIEAMQAEAARLQEKIEQAKKEKQRAEREERMAKAKAEHDAHYKKMYEESGKPFAGLNEAQHAIVYNQAYMQGHAHGYGEVESCYGDLAEMARKVLEVR